MTKTFKEIIDGIRTAILGIEVREDIAQGMEYVEQFAETSTTKAQEAAKAPPPQSGPRPILLLPRRKRCRRFLQKNRPVWMPSAPQKATR